MREASLTCGPKTSPVAGGSTCSPGSAVGTTPSSLPAGLMTGLCGPEAAPARHSPRPGRRSAPSAGPRASASLPDLIPSFRSSAVLPAPGATQGIYGLSSEDSSRCAALTECLASRLAAALDVNGSPEYAMIWRRSAIPQQPSIFRLAASARRTSGSGCSGWPTASLMDVKNPNPRVLRSGGAAYDNLSRAAMLCGWNTPRGTDGSKGGPNQSGGALPADAALAGWVTPQSRDWKGVDQNFHTDKPKDDCLPNQATLAASGETPASSSAGTGKPAAYRLNPLFSLWLMGYPAAWASSGARAKPSCRKSRRSSSGPA